jgi:hypothetical protein
VPGKAKSDTICRAFATGAPRGAAGIVFFGTEGQMSAFQRAKAGIVPWYYVDNSYFDKHRGLYFRVTKNALQVDPAGKKSDGKRFAKLGVSIKPWRTITLGEDILICPQSDAFMKSTLGCVTDWADETVRQLKAWDIPMQRVRVRPWNRDKVAVALALQDDLKNLRLLITHSSASAITAILEGIPAISTGDNAAAYRLGGPFTESNVLAPLRAADDQRLLFAQVLADNQFTLEEFRDGTAWAWLQKS